ncbi:MAG: hypothetical protein NTX42_00790 [Methanothrix sp.]|nr:hypothetical protein [Methanothrix sp.]
MNRKVVIVFILTLIALGFLTFYSFGPSSITRIGPQINPESLKPAKAEATNQNNESVEVYHNKDIAENFYVVSIPQSWQIQSTTSHPGGYDFVYNRGTSKTELMDVPDNSTLELFVLSQEEPRLKSLLPDYKRIDYQKKKVNGYDAYQLSILSDENGIRNESIKTYIMGPDRAAVITYSLPQEMVASLQNTFNLVTSSFHWENN